MKKFSTFVFSVSLVLAAIFTTACPSCVTIADIEANPAKYQNKEVIIVGTVKDSYGVSIPGTPVQGGALQDRRRHRLDLGC